MTNRRQDKETLGSKLAKSTCVGIVSLVASVIAIFAFFTNKQSIDDILKKGSTALPQPTQTPDVTSLYTFFPRPVFNSTRTYDYSVVYSDLSNGTPVEKKESGSYTEAIKIVNDKYVSEGITIVEVETNGAKYLLPCDGQNAYWYVYDVKRFYVFCSASYADDVGNELAHNKDDNLVVETMYETKPLTLMPVYLAPFEIDKQWQADYGITIQEKVTKQTPLGVFYDCYKMRFFLVHYEEFRYVCPTVGVVAIEVSSRGEFYTAALTSLK